jgi:hypothetical protein
VDANGSGENMYAVLVRVRLNDKPAVLSALKEYVVPWISEDVPGFVHGYWTVVDDGGVAMIVFKSEQDAKNASEQALLRGDALPDMVTLLDAEVREVVAYA